MINKRLYEEKINLLNKLWLGLLISIWPSYIPRPRSLLLYFLHNLTTYVALFYIKLKGKKNEKSNVVFIKIVGKSW